jgi:hypothetical protein
MRSTTCEAPPQWMIVIAGIFTPRFQRDLLKGDLIENLRCNSRREYAWCIGEQVLGVIRSQMWAAFDPWLLVGEVAFLYLPLFMAFPRAAFLPMALLLVSVLALQRVCDAYVYPAEGSASEMVMNTLRWSTFLWGSRIYPPFRAAIRATSSWVGLRSLA